MVVEKSVTVAAKRAAEVFNNAAQRPACDYAVAKSRFGVAPAKLLRFRYKQAIWRHYWDFLLLLLQSGPKNKLIN